MQYGLLQRSGVARVLLEMYLKKLVVVQVKRGGGSLRSMSPDKVKVFAGATGGRGYWCVSAGKVCGEAVPPPSRPSPIKGGRSKTWP